MDQELLSADPGVTNRMPGLRNAGDHSVAGSDDRSLFWLDPYPLTQDTGGKGLVRDLGVGDCILFYGSNG